MKTKLNPNRSATLTEYEIQYMDKASDLQNAKLWKPTHGAIVHESHEILLSIDLS